jgi:hypothetical protein
MIFFGLLGSILIGFIFYNTAIFHSSRSNFLFITAGLYGALFFSLLHYKNFKAQVFGMIIIFFLNLIVFEGKFISLAYFIRDICFLGGLFLSIKLYHLFLERNKNVKFYLRSLALACTFGLLNILSGTIIFLINSGWVFPPPLRFVYLLSRYGVLIGLGIGLGLDFYLQNESSLLKLFKFKTE